MREWDIKNKRGGIYCEGTKSNKLINGRRILSTTNLDHVEIGR